ncbi:MAG: family 16 glycoside hydrolase [Bacteroidota bacterium]
MNIKTIVLTLLVIFAGLVASINFPSCQRDVHESAVNRGHNPWVFRSVLDWRARMVTFALDDDFWVSYDAQEASIYKVWRDGVDFDGPVYTRAHGPQPVTKGPAWLQSPHVKPWYVKQGEDLYQPDIQYRGHQFKGKQAFLQYEMILKDGHSIEIEERPEFSKTEKGLIQLDRSFKTSDVPSGTEIWMVTHLNSLTSENGFKTNSTFEMDSSDTQIMPGVQGYSVDGKLMLIPNGKTQFTAYLQSKPMVVPAEDASEAETAAHPGENLIARSDCQTCHNPKEKAIGPSYVAIAEKYAFTPYLVSKLANKIINGGSGVWGAQLMSAHPGLPLSDAKQMVSYIMGMDGEKPAPKRRRDDKMQGTFAFNSAPRGTNSGLILNAYRLAGAYEKLPEMDEKKAPNYVTTVKGIHAVNRQDFEIQNSKLELDNDFYISFEGMLEIEKDDNYLFQLMCDDGGKLYIDGKEIIDNDGLHGYVGKEGEIFLSAGKHPIQVRYFQRGGGKAVSLFWLKHGADKYTPVPPSAFSHDPAKKKEAKPYIPIEKLVRAVPGDSASLQDVHPAFRLKQARPSSFKPMVGGMDFLSDGRMVVSTWTPKGSIYILSNLDAADPEEIKVKEIAKGLAEPLGVKIVDDEIYILQKQELTQLIDHDGDEVIDEYRTICNGWEVSSNFHEFAFGLAYKDDHFYCALAIAIEPGGKSTQPQIQDRGRAIKIHRETGKFEFLAHGLRTPNGVGLGVDQELFIADNQGDWLPANKIMHIEKGDFLGSRAVNFNGTANTKMKPPVVWLPQDEIGNSPSQPTYLDKGPYAGQMIHGEVTHGGLKRVFTEKVNGEYQGAVFRFTQGLEAGVNRVAWSPDGDLYVGGIGNPGNWGQTGKQWYGLQKLEFTGQSAFEMLAVRAKADGMEIEFTEPLADGDGFNKADYQVKQWYYLPTENYGGPKMDERNLSVKDVRVSQDRRRVFLQVDGMKKEHVVYIHLKAPWVSAAGHALWTTEAWYTLNNIPTEKGFISSLQATEVVANTLSEKEKREGWKLLFDGETTKGWRNFKSQTIGSAWAVENGTLTLGGEKDDWQIQNGGDIITDGEYENFELQLEWKISDCGNSGIIYLVNESEDYDYVWQTGPEMQILDNTCHPDGQIEKHRAGDLYDLIECKFVSVKAAGNWNKVRVIIKDGHLEHWLNGQKVVETELFTDEWKEMVASSKFVEMPGFGTYRKGHIALQDHGDRVWFRNIKIRELE